ncbi:hypothetical protein A0H81_14521 [Grifola frondosa]|uniref:Uncharacterized protein n=1 Tax=Grifola frondosa TaxID=5627 RepID=A0A1C7LL56_GRIFR|nr:hypothetical protein A0H81_14521 [Grifola frondosa]
MPHGQRLVAPLSLDQAAALHRAWRTKDVVEIIDIGEVTTISSRVRGVMIRMLGQGVRGAIVRGKGAVIERWNMWSRATASTAGKLGHME